MNATKKEVTIIWDAMLDDNRKEICYPPSTQRLLPSKWNKNVEGAWRMDIAIAVSGEEETQVLDSSIDINEVLENNDNDKDENDNMLGIYDDDNCSEGTESESESW